MQGDFNGMAKGEQLGTAVNLITKRQDQIWSYK